MTLPEIKAALPKYIYLKPGVHKWREGDDYFSKYEGWTPAIHMSTKLLCEFGTTISYPAVRRPIPDEVLENQAFWVLYNRLATVAPASDELGVTFYISRNALREEILRITLLHADLNTRRFLTSLEARKAIPLLGGEQNIIKHLSAGDLYSVWIGEQIG